VYEIGLKHALQNISANGGKAEGDLVKIMTQAPRTVKLEQGFPAMYPLAKIDFVRTVSDISFEFEGSGFSLAGEARKKSSAAPEYVFKAELYVDGEKVETASLPTEFTIRRLELFARYPLENKKHKVQIKVLNPNDQYELKAFNYVIFSDKPPDTKLP
jgi:hypothetical protein